MDCVAIIPARGNSKGIPKKNLQSVGAVPLIRRTVLAAQGAKLVDRIFVSTDCEKIAQASGSSIIYRPEDLAGDTASSESALLHALSQIPLPKILVFLQCTSPFVLSEDIDGAIRLYEEGYDCVFSAERFHGCLWTADARGINHDEKKRLRRQDMAPQFRENGAIYVMNAEKFLTNKNRFFGRIGIYEMPSARSMEIDSYDELLMAQIIAEGTI